MRKLVLLVGLVLLVTLSVSAQDNSKVDVFGGYSYLRFSPGNGAQGINFNGGIGSISYNPSSWIGVVGEFGGYHNGSVYGTGATANAYSYLFGPKVFMSSGKIEPFGQVLFGGVHGSATSGSGGTSVSANAFAMALGGGLDYKVAPHIAIRLGQIEYVMTRYNNSVSSGFGSGGTGMQNSFRYSAGVVLKF